jgi:hypothetical protein
MAFEFNPTAFKHVPWGGGSGLADIVVLGKDWSGATFLWQFGAATDLLIDISLANASAGSQGVSATYDAGYVHPETGAVVGATTIRPQIDEATLEALTYSGVADLELAHTFYITPSGEPERVYCYGTMTIKQGVADA